jgi:hypothetical protein
MSCLSNLLTQLTEKNEFITINNEKFKLTDNEPIFFATTGPTNEYLTNSSVDSLKITRIDHYLNSITKDILDKFRVVRFDELDTDSYIYSNMIANGFESGSESTQNLVNLVGIYKNILKNFLTRNGKA